MATTIQMRSPHFVMATSRAIGILNSLYDRLLQMYSDTSDLRDQNDLLYLSSMTQLAGCRGQNLIGDDIIVDRPVDENVDLVAQAVTAHVQVLEHVSARDPFEVLEFVGELGAICQGLRRYVQRH